MRRMALLGLGLAAVALQGCGGPFGLRIGINPDTLAQLRDDPAASCIVLETSPAGGARLVWWRSGTELPRPSNIRECLDPRSLPAAAAP